MAFKKGDIVKGVHFKAFTQLNHVLYEVQRRRGNEVFVKRLDGGHFRDVKTAGGIRMMSYRKTEYGTVMRQPVSKFELDPFLNAVRKVKKREKKNAKSTNTEAPAEGAD